MYFQVPYFLLGDNQMDYRKEQTTIDDSISFLMQQIPLQMKEIAYQFVNTMQLINVKMKGIRDYKSGIYSEDVINILGTPFTKVLLTLDEEAFINTHVFVRNLAKWYSHVSYAEDIIKKYKSSVSQDSGRIMLEIIRYVHMQAPYQQFKRVLTGTGFKTYMSKDDIPLLRVIPRIKFDAMDTTRNQSAFTEAPFSETYFNKDFEYIKDVDVFGIGHHNSRILCDLEIDIEGVYSVLSTFFTDAVFSYRKNKKEDSQEGVITSDSKSANKKGIDRELDEIIRLFDDFEKMSDEQRERYFFEPVQKLAGRIIYSSAMTFLATVTKTVKTHLDFIGEISSDVLDLSVDNLYDDVFITTSQSDRVKRGSLIRLLSTNIAPMMQAVLMSNTEKFYGKKNEGDITHFIKTIINDLYALRFQSWNYIKIPTDNIKFRKLYHIGSIAKKSFYLLNDGNKASLQLLLEDIKKRDKGEMSAFNGSDAIRVNGTFPTNKRYIDLLKSLLQNTCYMVILRYRMSSLASQNEYSTDELTLNRREYFDLNKTAFVQLRRSIKQLNSRVFSINKPEYDVAVGNINYDEDVDKPQGRKAYFNDFIYGITDETMLTNTDLQVYANMKSGRNFGNFEEEESYRTIRLDDIRNSYKKLLKRQESDYKGTISDKWFEILKSRITGVISNPFSNDLVSSAFVILEVTEDFNRLPYSKLHTGLDRRHMTKGEEPDDSGFWSLFRVTDDIFKQQHTSFSTMSLEEFEDAFEQYGEEIASGIVGDLSGNGILGDKVGYNFTLGITEQGKTIQNNIESGILPPEEVQQSLENFRSLRNRFDFFLATGEFKKKKKKK